MYLSDDQEHKEDKDRKCEQNTSSGLYKHAAFGNDVDTATLCTCSISGKIQPNVVVIDRENVRDLEDELKLTEQKKNRLVQQRNKLRYEGKGYLQQIFRPSGISCNFSGSSSCSK